jgi:hypothetical protein
LLPAVRIVDQNGFWIDMALPKEMLEVEYESNQPELWDGREFNTVIFDLVSGRSFVINSIELDFIDETTTYQIPVAFVETRKANLAIVAKTFDDACVLAEAHAARMNWGNIIPETKFIIANKE